MLDRELQRVALIVFLVGCNGGPNPAIDAAATSDAVAAVDAAVDAPIALVDAPADAPDPAAKVEITVLKQDGTGDPAATAIAVFRDPNDQVVQHGPVDANGIAFAYLPNGGSVTVMHAYNHPNDLAQRSHEITTIRAVKPGDRLRAGSPRTPAYRVGAQTGMAASFTPIPSSSQPYLLSSCGGGTGLINSTTVALSFIASCVTPTFDLLSLYDGNDLVRRFVWQTNVAYAAGGAFTIPNTWQTMPRNTTRIDNVPTNLARVFAGTYLAIGGNPVELERRSIEIPPAGTNTIPLYYAVAPGQSTVITANIGTGFGIPHTHVLVTKGSPANVVFDLNAQPLPNLGISSASASAVSWTQTGAASGDARLVGWFGRWVDTNGVQNYANWQIVEPADSSTTSTLPSFPTAYASDDPTVAAGLTMLGSQVYYVEYDNLANYDAARPHGFLLFYVEQTFLDVEHRAHTSRSRSQ